MSSDLQANPADAVRGNWLEQAPKTWRPYLQLMRLDRPIGAWLLFWPCVFGLALGALAQDLGFLGQTNDWRLLALFAVGTVVMRGAGCTYNDIVDRDIDARVARTRGRPLPSGAVSLRAAWIFLAAQCTIGLIILLCLNWFSVALGAASLILIALYPFMKRITWWPQAWLGLTFNWGALLGYAAMTGGLAAQTFMLYAGCFFWTLGYDTIYALQDAEDDALIGVKSTARLFGERAPYWIALFYALAFGLFVLTLGWATLLGRHSDWALMLSLPALLHLMWQVRRLEPDDPANCLRLFRSNREAGALIAAALIAATWIVR
jgi:4-hydroxybenzoate polyprenyltransferase